MTPVLRCLISGPATESILPTLEHAEGVIARRTSDRRGLPGKPNDAWYEFDLPVDEEVGERLNRVVASVHPFGFVLRMHWQDDRTSMPATQGDPGLLLPSFDDFERRIAALERIAAS